MPPVARVRTLTSPTSEVRRRARASRDAGFTLLEVVVAIAIAALFVGVAVPSGWQLYQSAQYRKAVRDITVAAASARYNAVTSGIPQDVVVNARAPSYLLRQRGERIRAERFRELPGAIAVSAVTAAEVSPGGDLAAIRFYPDGSSSGGSIAVRRGGASSDSGVRLRVDWLLGHVSQEPL